jgi:signal transduction histidine kinase
VSSIASALTPAQAREHAEALWHGHVPSSIQDALDARQRLLALARQAGDDGLVADALLWEHLALLVEYHRDEASETLEQSRALAQRMNDAARLAACDVAQAQVLRIEGRYVEAMTNIRRALPLLDGHRDAGRVRQYALRIMCDVYTSLGLWDEAIDMSARAGELATGRGDRRAALRAQYDEMYSRWSRAEARVASDAVLSQDDADVVRVETASRAYLRSGDLQTLNAGHATVCRQLLFEVLVRTGREAQALEMWREYGALAPSAYEHLDNALVAFWREGPERTLAMLLPVIDDPQALTAENRAKAWRVIADAHEKLGDHRSAFEALRKHMRLEIGEAQTTAKAQAALFAMELDAEREKQLAQRALAHAGKPAAVGRLASSMAHELSQPSAALMLLGADAREALRSSRWDLLADVLGDIEQQVERLGRLIDRMKDFSSEDPVRIERLNLHDVVEEALRLCRPAMQAAGVSCATEVPDIALHGDKERLILAMVNLVNNALDAMRGQRHPAPALRIEATCEHGAPPQVCLAVIDNGPGLGAEVHAHVLEPFFTTKSTGLGLGLTITREALAGMCARLEAGNEPARGARFTIVVPAAGALASDVQHTT